MDSKTHPGCTAVAQALAARIGSPLPAELAEHLASCPRCAARARRAAVLDRLWDATRPAEPPASCWDALWSEVARASAPPTAPAPLPRTPTRRLVPRPALVGAAAAAALLVAVLLAVRSDRRDPPLAQQPLPPPPAPARDQHFEVEAGQLLTIRVDAQGVQADRRPQEQISATETVPWDLALYNGVEAITMAAQW